MNHPYITIPLLSCLLSALGHAHVITGDSTQIDDSDGKATELRINNYTGDSVISVPAEYKQVYVLGSAEIDPFSDTGRSLYVESDSSILINGDVSAKIVQAQVGVTNANINITGNVTVSSMFAIAEPTNTVRIGGTLTINGLNTFIENGSNVYAGGIQVSKALTGVKIAGNIYTNSFVASAATTTLQSGALLTHQDSDADGTLLIKTGSIVNCSGTIELDTELLGGTFSLNEAAIISAVTMDKGTLKVLGDAQTGSLTLNAGNIIFTSGATLDLNGASLIWSDEVSITINVDDVNNISGNIILFDNISDGSILPENLTVNLADKTASKKLEVSLQNNAVVIPGNNTVPEPATATLAILGLASLLFQRRRG